MKKEVLVSMLLSMRSQIDGILYYMDELVEEEESEKKECFHKNKMNLTTMGGKEKWVCKDCDYKFGFGENETF